MRNSNTPTNPRLIFSKRISLEKKADIKGNPINLKLANTTTLLVWLKNFVAPPIHRKSWPLLALWIMLPVPTNNIALKKAWAIKWINLILGRPILRNQTISPSCLKVDKATIFFKSVSIKAFNPAIKEVALPTKLR